MTFQSAHLVAPSVLIGDATSQHLFDTARLLRQDGAQTEIICNYAPGPTPDDLRPLVRQADYAAYRAQPELFLLEYPSWCPLAERIRTTQGVAVFSYHGVTPPALWGVEAGREQLRISEVRTQLAWFAHLALTVSGYMRTELHHHSGYPLERIHVVPFHVPVERFVKAPSASTLAQLRSQWRLNGKRVLLFVGRIAGNKRIDLAIAALGQLLADEPMLHLLIVGSTDGNPAERELTQRLTQQAERLGLSNYVTFTGRVDQIEPYFHLADIVLLPSQHEGFGVPLIEGMAAGKPVVASDSAAMPWVLAAEAGEQDAAGLLFAPGDASDLARQLRRLLSDEGLRAAFIARGKARVAAFTLEQFSHNMRQALAAAAELAHEPPPAAQSPVGQLVYHADVVLRNYQVRSGAPLVGRLIEWVRRNSTTHVKEAYVDPMMEQQVNFNRMLADEMIRLQAEVRQLRNEVDQLQERLGGREG